MEKTQYKVTFFNGDGSEERFGLGLVKTMRAATKRQKQAIASSLCKGRQVAISSVDLEDGQEAGSELVDVSEPMTTYRIKQEDNCDPEAATIKCGVRDVELPVWAYRILQELGDLMQSVTLYTEDGQRIEIDKEV